MYTKLQSLRIALGNPVYLYISFSTLAFSKLRVAHDPENTRQISGLFNALLHPNLRTLEDCCLESNMPTLFDVLSINFMYNHGRMHI
jgi:hypothetical protein